jgi:branched-chain amino acid transport system ATP-binding protein
MSLLQVENLSKQFSGLMAVYGLDLAVEQGEIVGLIGPNGAGKTTTFNLLSGFLTPTTGTITFDGKVVNGRKPHEICALGLTRTFQIVQPFPDITAWENILIGAFARYPSAAAAGRKAREVADRVGLGHKLDTRGQDLTLMELKRLEIGKALATEPKMLLLDEVASGLNPVEVEELLTLVRKLNAEGVTLLVVEHVMQVIMNLSHRIVVLNFGEKIAEGTPEEIARHPQVLEAYLGQEVPDA